MLLKWHAFHIHVCRLLGHLMTRDFSLSVLQEASHMRGFRAVAYPPVTALCHLDRA